MFLVPFIALFTLTTHNPLDTYNLQPVSPIKTSVTLERAQPAYVELQGGYQEDGIQPVLQPTITVWDLQ